MDAYLFENRPKRWEDGAQPDPDTLDLFATPAPPAAHTADHATSRAAAESLAPEFLKGLRVEVYRAFVEAAPEGLTDVELEALPQFKDRGYGASTLRKRRSELYKQGYLEERGRRDGCAVWRLPYGAGGQA